MNHFPYHPPICETLHDNQGRHPRAHDCTNDIGDFQDKAMNDGDKNGARRKMPVQKADSQVTRIKYSPRTKTRLGIFSSEIITA